MALKVALKLALKLTLKLALKLALKVALKQAPKLALKLTLKLSLKLSLKPPAKQAVIRGVTDDPVKEKVYSSLIKTRNSKLKSTSMGINVAALSTMSVFIIVVIRSLIGIIDKTIFSIVPRNS